jgi:transposase
MLGLLPAAREQALFSYAVRLDQRIPGDHLLRKIQAVLDLEFVVPLVRPFYGLSGNPSVDPRVIVRLMLLLFLYDIPSERELMEQVPLRLDFLWFLGFDLDTKVPDHSVLSKARARWGTEVFQKVFVKGVEQCVRTDLVQGKLSHVDSTMVKAQASKSSVVSTSPELVEALRQAYREQEAKLEMGLAPEPAQTDRSAEAPAQEENSPRQPALAVGSEPSPESQAAVGPTQEALPQKTFEAFEPQVLPAPELSSPAAAETPKAKKRPVNADHISLTDPQAELARSKNGLTELNHKEHRVVDDGHGVITAVEVTSANIPDGAQLVPLLEQHFQNTQLDPEQTTVAGDHHYGTADNYIYCVEQGIRPHLGEVSAHLKQRGKLPLEQFVYEPEQDRLKCPQGHYLVFHQNRPLEQAKVYRIEDPAHCANCPLRGQCTEAKEGRSIQRHVQAELIDAARTQAQSRAGRVSRKRRQHVMEGSFADAANNHGSKRARWRGQLRQKIQSWMIAAVQNLRILVKVMDGKKATAAAAAAGQLVGGASGRTKSLDKSRCIKLWRLIQGERTFQLPV